MDASSCHICSSMSVEVRFHAPHYKSNCCRISTHQKITNKKMRHNRTKNKAPVWEIAKSLKKLMRELLSGYDSSDQID